LTDGQMDRQTDKMLYQYRAIALMNECGWPIKTAKSELQISFILLTFGNRKLRY